MYRTRTAATAFAVAITGVLAVTVTASAIEYPPPAKPKTTTRPSGPFKTLTVCKKKSCKYRTIQSAVDKAKAGDTIKVKPGTYAELVLIKGANKRYIRLIGDPKHPGKVLLNGKKFPAGSAVTINGANGVEVNGFTARDYSANGFFVTNNTGYKLTNLVAKHVGVYGIYAFNSVGGEMSNSTAAWNNDGGFYIGQTPPQKKPVRTIAKNLTSYGNVLGWSGTNMRYVTITKSKFFNNGTGLAPNALDSEKYAPAEDNVISDNDIFLNNFDYYYAAPFRIRPASTPIPFPVGAGILLLAGHRNTVQNNRVYGNYLVGIGALNGFLEKQTSDDAPDANVLVGSKIQNNQFGNGGKNLNGRDLFYPGGGKGNCWDLAGTQNNAPASNLTFLGCTPGRDMTATEPADDSALVGAIGWLYDKTVGPASSERGWIQHPQAAVPGVTPLTRWSTSIGTK